MGVGSGVDSHATPLDPNEAEGLIPSISTQTELNEFEALNIAAADQWARSSRHVKVSLLTIQTLDLLHKRMFGEVWRWAGKHRLTQKSIGVGAYQISTQLRMLMDDAMFWLEHESFAKAEIAARFHHRLVWVHAYPNGNGRHARLATDCLCRNQGWALPSWGSANLIVASSPRLRYIEALRIADQGSFEELAHFLYS